MAFLPPNVTSLIQPMDQEVVQNIKRSYRSRLLQELLLNDRQTSSIIQKLKKINIKHAIEWVADAWNNVTARNLQKSWKNLWPNLTFETHIFELQKRDETRICLKLMRSLPSGTDLSESDFLEWESGDTQINKDELLSDQEIVDVVRTADCDVDSDVEEGEREIINDDEEISTPKISHGDAEKAFDCILQYIEQQTDLQADPSDMMFLRRARNFAFTKKGQSLKHQKKVTDFFK